MKKIIILCSMALGIIFLSGCGQSQTSQTQPAIPTQNQPIVNQQSNAQIDTNQSNDIKNSKIYYNARAGYKFSYDNSETIDETIKYSRTASGNAKNKDLVQFTSNGLVYSVETTVAVKENNIEDWLKNNDGNFKNITDYEKIEINGKNAYQLKNKASTFVMGNGNVFNIIARNGIAPTNSNDSRYIQLLNSFQRVQ